MDIYEKKKYNPNKYMKTCKYFNQKNYLKTSDYILVETVRYEFWTGI